MKKTILPLCGALLLSAGLVACGGNGGNTDNKSDNTKTSESTQKEKVYLSLWVPSEQVEWAEERIEAFKADPSNANKDIKVDIQAAQEGDIQEKVKNDPEAAADVFFFSGDHLGVLYDGGYLYPYSESVSNYVKGTMPDNIYASGTVGEQLYGIPYTPNTYFMYYDSSKITADDAKDLDKILEKGKVIFDIDNGWYQTAFWYGTGVRFFGEDGKDPTQANLDSNEGKIAAKAIRNYALNPNFINGGDVEIKSLFTKDNADNIVAVVGGSWISESLISSFGEDLEATMLPVFHYDGTEYYMYATGDWKKCGISKYTNKPIEAQQLALWLTNKDSALSKLQRFNEAPVLTELNSNEVVLSNKIAQASIQQTAGDNKHVVLQPSISQMSNWWSAAESYGKALIAAKDAGEEFSDTLCEEWAAKLQEDLLKKLTA